MRLKAEIAWRVDAPGAARLDPRLLDLLRALEQSATLRAAAEQLDLSYRGAWGLLLEASAQAGAPLAELQRGRGARLTRFGASLLRNDARLREAVEPIAERLAVTPQPSASAAAPLRVAASHDPLLVDFCDRFARPSGLVGAVAFKGSEDALAQYARGAADLAGFHMDEASHAPQLRRHLKPRDRLVRFARREQGLIVAHGNPRRLLGLADVVRRRARFVNRQRGSGTRALVDRLLRDAGIAPESVRGYENEEYTHLAVAATVAAGRAEAGLGVHAAAAQLGLDFVPIVQERYWLAIRQSLLSTSVGQRLLDGLGGKPLSRLARAMPGYDIQGAGAVLLPSEVFR